MVEAEGYRRTGRRDRALRRADSSLPRSRANAITVADFTGRTCALSRGSADAITVTDLTGRTSALSRGCADAVRYYGLRRVDKCFAPAEHRRRRCCGFDRADMCVVPAVCRRHRYCELHPADRPAAGPLAGAAGNAEFARPARPPRSDAGVAIGADKAAVAARSIRHPGKAGGALLDDLNLRRAVPRLSIPGLGNRRRWS